jgi:glycosyltransferase involved in cell wall biosynthesis
VLAPQLEGEVRAVRVLSHTSKGCTVRVFGWLRHAELRITATRLSVDHQSAVELTLNPLIEGGCVLFEEIPFPEGSVEELPVLVIDLNNGRSIAIELAWIDRVATLDGYFRYEVSVPGQRFPAWATGSSSEDNCSKRICIVTGDFVGPIQNGGMGTCYTNMAQLLAGHGHDVTVLYDLGEYSEQEGIEFWIDYYAKQGITFIPMPRYAGRTTATWLRERSYAIYQWLVDRDFEWIHFHEMVGGGFYTTLAAKLGIAFRETSICVGLHSPTRWHLHYNHTFPASVDQLEVDHMERVTVECADILFSPSQYLLGWCWKDGWALSETRVVIPYPLVIEESSQVQGGRQTIDEIVFFGRLESRKGLRLFCDAVDTLVARGITPQAISFLGKEASEEGLASGTYIEKRSRRWGTETKILSSFGRNEAVEYLSTPGRLAVFASLADNSPYTIYECLGFGIPFVASNVGGIPELIAEDAREHVLFDLQEDALADKLEQALTRGIEPARAASSVEQLNRRWLEFHQCPPVSARAQRRQARCDGSLLAVLFIPEGNKARYEDELARMQEYLSALPEPVEMLVPRLNSSTGTYDTDEIRRVLGTCSSRYVLPCSRAFWLDPFGVEQLLRAAEVADADLLCPVLHVCDPEDTDKSAQSTELPLGGALLINIYREHTGGSLVAIRREILCSEEGLAIQDLRDTSRLLSKAMESSLLILPVPEVLGMLPPDPEHDYSRDEFESAIERLDSVHVRALSLWQREFLHYSVGLFNRARSHHLLEPAPSSIDNRLSELFVASEQMVLRADSSSGFDRLEPFREVSDISNVGSLSFTCGVKPAQWLVRDSMLSGSAFFVAKLTVVAQYPISIAMQFMSTSQVAFSSEGEGRAALPAGLHTCYVGLSTKKSQGFVNLSFMMQAGHVEVIEFELRRASIPGFGSGRT